MTTFLFNEENFPYFLSSGAGGRKTNLLSSYFTKAQLKGIVQRKLGWVRSGVNRWVMLRYLGAGHFFLILKGHHLVFRIKRFAPLEPKLLVMWERIGEVLKMVYSASRYFASVGRQH